MRKANRNSATGIAPEIHDLLASKLVAGREKDISWVRAAIKHRIAEPMKLVPLLDQISAKKVLVEQAKERLASLVRKAAPD